MFWAVTETFDHVLPLKERITEVRYAIEDSFVRTFVVFMVMTFKFWWPFVAWYNKRQASKMEVWKQSQGVNVEPLEKFV